MKLQLAPYLEQRATWPQQGRHIMAQYSDAHVVVYQAFNPAIAAHAVEHQRFGGPFRLDRMSWIKPNFLWMMYRSGWASKPGQEHVLAIAIQRAGFEAILDDAVASSLGASGFATKAAWKEAMRQSSVRLQWDPDHDPAGHKVPRRAIQLGLAHAALESYVSAWTLWIEDITPFVHEQREVLRRSGSDDLVTPLERVYPGTCPRSSA